MALYKIEMIQTPSAGSASPYTFDVLDLTVGCVLTAVADFVVPSTVDRTYILY